QTRMANSGKELGPYKHGFVMYNIKITFIFASLFIHCLVYRPKFRHLSILLCPEAMATNCRPIGSEI
ncbi:hypothetical protein P3699_26145, partial [Vibrio parahaemolyticus]|uniref:hypothetical protein n=1 Tax=Vibrio parahaemolyticus TaxID=670 RepID=UPI001BAED7DD